MVADWASGKRKVMVIYICNGLIEGFDADLGERCGERRGGNLRGDDVWSSAGDRCRDRI